MADPVETTFFQLRQKKRGSFFLGDKFQQWDQVGRVYTSLKNARASAKVARRRTDRLEDGQYDEVEVVEFRRVEVSVHQL